MTLPIGAASAPPRTLSHYMQLQLQDLKDMDRLGTQDDTGFKSKTVLLSEVKARFGAKTKHLPYRGRPKAFVVNLPKRLSQLWIKITEPEDVWRSAFRRYLRLYHSVVVKSLGIHGYSVDHVYPKSHGLAENVRYTRLLLVKTSVNSSWGNWEKNYVTNDPRSKARSSTLTTHQILKVSGFNGPLLPVTEQYIADAARYLVKTGLMQASKTNFYEELRHYLHRGNFVTDAQLPADERRERVQEMIAERMRDVPIAGVPGWNYGYTA